MRNALSLVLLPLLSALALAQTAWTGWDTPAGKRLGAPGLSSPVLKSAPIPDGTFVREHGSVAETVDVQVTIEKDGRVRPVSITHSLDPKKGGLDDQAKSLVKAWVFEPGSIKGKPARVTAILSVPFGKGKPMPPPGKPISGLREWAAGLRNPREPGVLAPIRLMGIPPAYPDAVIAARTSGSVEVVAEILASGHVGRTLVITSLGRAADDAAVSSVKEWLYLPATADGFAVPSYLIVTIGYNLQ